MIHKMLWRDLNRSKRDPGLTKVRKIISMNETNLLNAPSGMEQSMSGAGKGNGVEQSEAIVAHDAANVVGNPVAPIKADGKPRKEGYIKGTEDQLNRLSQLHNVDMEALRMAQDRGFLGFKVLKKGEVYGVTDSSGNVVEMCQLNGRLFPAWKELPARKSHALNNSDKSWPLGILEAKDCPTILLTMSIPDFLAAFQVIKAEGAVDRVAPVAMVEADSSIGDEALPYFKGKHVRIIPHSDESGLETGIKWANQLLGVGDVKVDFINLDLAAQN
jgi:hypothetical protein